MSEKAFDRYFGEVMKTGLVEPFLELFDLEQKMQSSAEEGVMYQEIVNKLMEMKIEDSSDTAKYARLSNKFQAKLKSFRWSASRESKTITLINNLCHANYQSLQMFGPNRTQGHVVACYRMILGL